MERDYGNQYSDLHSELAVGALSEGQFGDMMGGLIVDESALLGDLHLHTAAIGELLWILSIGSRQTKNSLKLCEAVVASVIKLPCCFLGTLQTTSGLFDRCPAKSRGAAIESTSPFDLHAAEGGEEHSQRVLRAAPWTTSRYSWSLPTNPLRRHESRNPHRMISKYRKNLSPAERARPKARRSRVAVLPASIAA